MYSVEPPCTRSYVTLFFSAWVDSFYHFIFGFVDPGKGKLRNSPGFPSLGLFCSLLAANEFKATIGGTSVFSFDSVSPKELF